MEANASKHKAMSYGHTREQATQLREEVRALPAYAQAADTQDDATCGADRRGDAVSADLKIDAMAD